MSKISGRDLPEMFMARTEYPERERKQSPASLNSGALELLKKAEALQGEEVRRRLASRTGKTVPNERGTAWLDTWGLIREISPPVCE